MQKMTSRCRWARLPTITRAIKYTPPLPTEICSNTVISTGDVSAYPDWLLDQGLGTHRTRTWFWFYVINTTCI